MLDHAPNRVVQMEFWKADNREVSYREDIIKKNTAWMLFCPSLRVDNNDDDDDDDIDTDSDGISRSRTRRRRDRPVNPEDDRSDRSTLFQEAKGLSDEPTREYGFTSRLWPYTRVQAAVRVLNGRLGGPLSNVIEFRTPEGGTIECRQFCYHQVDITSAPCIGLVMLNIIVCTCH